MSAGSQSDELVSCADVAPHHEGIRPAHSGRLSSGGDPEPPFLPECVSEESSRSFHGVMLRAAGLCDACEPLVSLAVPAELPHDYLTVYGIRSAEHSTHEISPERYTVVRGKDTQFTDDASSLGHLLAESKEPRERMPAMSAKERNRQAQRAYRERQKASKRLILFIIGAIWDSLGLPRTLSCSCCRAACPNDRQRYKIGCAR